MLRAARWAQFPAQALTLANQVRDFPEWHQGRPWFAIWALLIESADYQRVFRQFGQSLADLLIAPYQRQAHITVAVAGFLATAAQQADDYSPWLWRADVANLQQLPRQSFELELTETDSFSLSPYLAVGRGTTQLQRLNRCLHQAYPRPAAGYIPHLTLGLYRAAWPTLSVQSRLAALNLPQLPRLNVTRLNLLVYRSQQLAGPLYSLGYYDLLQQVWQGNSAVESGGWFL